ncbi:possible 4'-phosphopantetheinyl transferase family protein [Prochlorococcus marinus str. MIT 9515]|uniref:Possible 4'-phosphopantetheinyl transferase family protein n=1 Tax=Prochlorococcus marinus (strain MIT 9515) TaxID=167542 RepID=A2BU36_PROM5|nr:4'-phosphopantetheinyl transferase [Prochlorococcus marinus]ABM71297.1 possible 4'-phosphopantetheinyl transferase family protein [Prochlorococcus marinus str. MIT 9515]
MTLLNNYDSKIPKIWFHKIKGVQDVATLKELEIANKLSKQRANIFLESRAYIRQSLGTLFNINPLEIPIIADPGEPPKLPKGMGYLSFSHCCDAIILVWHEKKIGIDIERVDRDFSYMKLAKKYFLTSKKSNQTSESYKKSILNQWCAIEAAIKWNHGKLSEDLKEWQYYENEKTLFHNAKKLKLKFTQITFYKWTISLAYKDISQLISNIICSSKII